MPFCFKSSKRSGAKSGKYSSPSTPSSSPSSHQQPPAREPSNYYSNHAGPSHPIPPPGYGRPATSHPYQTPHRNVLTFDNRPATSHVPTRYPSHRSVSPLGTSRFEQPSPYTFTRRDPQPPQPRRHRSIKCYRGGHGKEVPQMGHDGYFGPPPTLPPRAQPQQHSSSSSFSSRPQAIEVPHMGYDGYFGASDTTVPHQGAGVGRRNAVRHEVRGRGGATFGRGGVGGWERY